MAKQVLPRDGSGGTVPLTPATIALAVTVNGSISASSSITLNAATSFLRVYAISQDVYFKWGTTTVTSSNFDEVIPAGQLVDLVVPVNTATNKPFTAVKFIERTASATIIVIEK